jgi:hypothetical protein
MREYALTVLKFEGLYSAVFENRAVHYFLRFIPSLPELVMMGKLLHHVVEKRADGTQRFDRVIVDAPATGHAVTFFSVPQVLIDTLPPGSMASEARGFRDLLVDPRITVVALVSLPEELPVNETLELHDKLKDTVHLTPGLVILNGFVPPRFSDADLQALPPALREVARVQTVRAKLSAVAWGRLQAPGLPVLTVPRYMDSEFGRPTIERIATLLGGPGVPR